MISSIALGGTGAKFPKNGKLYIFQKMEIFSRFPKKRFRGFTPLKNKIAMDLRTAIGFSAAQISRSEIEQGRKNRDC